MTRSDFGVGAHTISFFCLFPRFRTVDMLVGGVRDKLAKLDAERETPECQPVKLAF